MTAITVPLKETQEELEKTKKDLNRIEGDINDITSKGLEGGDVSTTFKILFSCFTNSNPR